MRLSRFLYLFLLGSSVLGAVALPREARAASASLYSAEVVELPATLVLSPGEKGVLKIGFKNTGSKTWRISGPGYVSAYTFDPKYRLSRLEDKIWRRRDQPAVISAVTAPGETGYLSIPVNAPMEPGLYSETFQLAAEDTAWVTGGKFVVKVEVKAGSLQNDRVSTTPAVTLPHKALLLVRSHKKIQAAGGEVVPMRFGFKNIGDTTWFARGITSADVALASIDALTPEGRGSFADTSWLSSREIVKIAAGTVTPGQTEFYDFSIRTPDAIGEYTMRLQLTAGGSSVTGGEIEVPVVVTSNAALTSGEPVPFSGEAVLAAEPRIRVGLFKVTEPVEFKAAFPYVVRDVNGAVVFELPADTQAILHFKNNQYTFYAKGTTLKSDTHFRFEPAASSTDSHFEIQNHVDRPKWNTALNYNTFRDTLELRYSKDNDTVWAINELPMEQYLAGLAEISEYKATEFHKAMAVAERTYAYYQLQDGRKHATRNFDVNASQGDQVYAGYAREKVFPKVVEGVRATAGEMMTYNKDVVITPYFAQSAGRTYSWKEVWGGKEKPWVVSVVTTYDKGRIKYGHGVGMSQYDASKRAEKEGLDYKTLLKYYYRGVEVEKIYR